MKGKREYPFNCLILINYPLQESFARSNFLCGRGDNYKQFQYSKNFIISENDLRAAHYGSTEELTAQDVEKLAKGLEQFFPNLTLCKGSVKKKTRQCISNPLALLPPNRTPELIARGVNHFLQTRYPDFHRRVYSKTSTERAGR